MTTGSSDLVTILGVDKNGAMNLLYRKSRVEWRQKDEESKKSNTGKVRDMASFRRHFRMGFMTMPASQERDPLSSGNAMPPRSLSCHSVGSAPEESRGESGPTGRRPPAKPKRNPSTKLSFASEGRVQDERRIRKEGGSLKSASESRRMPPQKPQRSPHTHLSASFDETYARRPASTSAILPCSSSHSPEEPVYIEMVGNVSRGHPPPSTPAPPDEDSDGEEEAIYEEMKYPVHEDHPSHLRHPHRRHPPPRRTPDVDIPPPFPNLLQHRPPLLGAPSGKGNKVTKPGPPVSSKLPVPQKELPPSVASSSIHLPPSGRARSHSTPLPPQGSVQHRPESVTPISRGSGCTQEKGTSMLPIPHGQSRDKSLSYTMVYSSVKVTHSLLPASQVEEKTEREISVLAGLICPASRVSGTQLPSRPPSAQLHQGLREQSSPVVWTYPAGRRPPAYENSMKGSRGTQATDTRGGTVEEERGGTVWELQRRMSCGRRSQLGEPIADGSRVWNGNPARPEKGSQSTGGSGIPVRTQQSLDGASGRGAGRTGLPVPCQTFPSCHRATDLGGIYRLGRSASTSGVRQASTQRQSQTLLPSTTPVPSSSKDRDGKLQEVIERKRFLCHEIKSRQPRVERGLCKQESLPILPSWRRVPEGQKGGTPPCHRQQAVVWDTAI